MVERHSLGAVLKRHGDALRTLAAFSALWLLFSIFLVTNRAIGEKIARSHHLNNGADTGAAGMYHLVGGLVLVFIWLWILWRGVPMAFGVEADSFQKHGKLLVRTYIAFVLFTYLILASVAFSAASPSWRMYQLNTDALEAGGEQHVSCLDAVTTVGATLQGNATLETGLAVSEGSVWVLLSDPGWTVDLASDAALRNTVGAFTYLSAPVVYNGSGYGSGEGCAFLPRIYAVCAYDKDLPPDMAPSFDVCGWSLSDNGSAVTLRRVAFSRWSEGGEMDHFPTPPAATLARRDLLWEFAAEPMENVKRSVAAVNDQRLAAKSRMWTMWLVASAVVLAALLYGMYKLPEHGYEAAHTSSEYREELEMSMASMPGAAAADDGDGGLTGSVRRMGSRAGSRAGDDFRADLERSQPLLAAAAEGEGVDGGEGEGEGDENLLYV